jgi:hypothetical protein
MKRLFSASLALCLGFGLLGTTAAEAGSFDRNHHPARFDQRYEHGYHGDHWDRRYRHDNTGTAVAVGVGLIALTAILAAQHEGRERPDDRAYDNTRYDNDRYGPPPSYGPDGR